jgi:hypothetical protein
MTWRGTATPQDRLFASLPYVLPLMEVCLLSLLPMPCVTVSVCLLQFPVFQLHPCTVWLPLIRVYTELSPSPGLIVFILLLTLVVRNTNVSHFIRFNTMQAILLDIVILMSRPIHSRYGPRANYAGWFTD